MSNPLTDQQRKQIHDLALDARTVLTREVREVLEGVYGLYADGRMDPAERLPQVQADPETAALYRRIAHYLEDEVQAGLSRAEAVEKLVREAAFTHLNRLAAFKMLEARKLIRGTLDKGPNSNAFKFYLADPEHSADLASYESGDVETAYRRFLLWQAGQVAREVRVLFDPDALPGLLSPRTRALTEVLALLNQPDLADIWLADETVGWLYQYFNEPELQAAFEKVRTSGAKFDARDIPSATQLFTLDWIVRFLIHNTLGRLWVELHPNTRLLGTDALDYLVPSEENGNTEGPGISNTVSSNSLEPRLVKTITMLDPACGTMHFGLVAFDLFAAMYQEELERAGTPGWPATPSVSSQAEIPAAIIQHNLFGIDIDLRAVQLGALALYLRAKALNPQAKLTDSNLARADVQHFGGAALGAFLREARFTQPIYERAMLTLWEKLEDATQLGSLLRLERELDALIARERARYAEAPLFAGIPGEFEREAAEEEFWGILSAQIVQGLDEFARQQARAGVDQAFFTGEAAKGLRLADFMLRRYDVVVTNPPYLSRRKMNRDLADLVDAACPEGKNDFYAAFIMRCLELAEKHGRVGMLTMHSFMFISSYESLRTAVRREAAIETLVHCGPGLFEVGNSGTLQTAAFVLRKETAAARREAHAGTYFRLVYAPNGDAKRCAFEEAMVALGERTETNDLPSNVYQVTQRDFDAIPTSPWVYWISDSLRCLFQTLPKMGDVAQPRQGLATADNARFLRFWWEIGGGRIVFDCRDREAAQATNKQWFPCTKGGAFCRWYGNQEYVVNWRDDGSEMRSFDAAVIRNPDYYFQEGMTWSLISTGKPGFRWMPRGRIITHKGPGIFFDQPQTLYRALAISNSEPAANLLCTTSPTLGFEIGHMVSLPWPTSDNISSLGLVFHCIGLSRWQSTVVETTFDFTAPLHCETGMADQTTIQTRLAILEAQIDDEVYRLYGISDADRSVIEAELAGGKIDDSESVLDDSAPSALDEGDPEATNRKSEIADPRELAVRWISYAAGIVLGRFQPGVAGALGSAIYRREDFAVGSLPAPDVAEFDLLVGPPERFAYVDESGGRHLFSAEVETTLRALALPDGIAVLDKGHPRDLPALVERALTLMLGAGAAQDVIDQGAGGDLRAFLERDFFTRWHLKWYRKRPVYWPLQSARRSYGFVIFHERIERATLYVLMRDYLDGKLALLGQQFADAQAQRDGLQGRARKQVEREIAALITTLEEVANFLKTIDRLVRAGYEPAPDWIDDGVLLRLAPLWELIPLWKREPQQAWERLERGDYDWSHIAMHYWPERVRQACRKNKSFAIAHGHAEWYQGR